MQAFLLVAGLGTRLRPLTDRNPKCLLPLGRTNLLEIWLDHLRDHGVDEVVVNTHWLSGRVEAFVAGRAGEPPRVRLFHEPELLGSGGTLLANREWVADGEPFFIIYGDNLTGVDLTAMLACHRAHGLPFTLGVFRAEEPARCGIATVDGDGLVTGFVEKPEKPASDLAAAGIYVADRRLFDYFPGDRAEGRGRVLDLGFDILPHLVGRMKVFEVGRLIDIGTPESYAKAQKSMVLARWKKSSPESQKSENLPQRTQR